MPKTIYWYEHRSKKKKQKMILKKIFFKLANNVVFGKTMENILQIDILLVTIERKRNYLVSEPNYHTTKFSKKIR